MDIVINKIGGIWNDDWIQPMAEEKYKSFDIYLINSYHFCHFVEILKSINSDPRLNKRKPKNTKTDNDLKDGMMEKEEEEEETKDDMDNEMEDDLKDDMMEEEGEDEELKDEAENEANKDEEEKNQDKSDDLSNEKMSPIKESKQISKKKDGKGKKKKKKDKKERKRRSNRRIGNKTRPKYNKKIGKNQGEEPTKKQREGYTISAIGFLMRMLQRPTNLKRTYGVDLTWVMKKSLDIGFYPFISNAIDVKYLCLNSTSLW